MIFLNLNFGNLRIVISLQSLSENHFLGELMQTCLYREMNIVAGELANLSSSYSLGPVCFNQAHASCHHFLTSNAIEISTSHDVLL
ncbi:hypothetical protein D8674_015298 [Pyrus ussuriensis x Pyrus communis]|uniref:Uncharacterized protein n=1 Tax=Pyrus ussuriensis x Pyrus communis TaxID=2448454 RepID=A0A5N5GUZ0_9ROSA|nr:hypothetical protein D8674_015298 [Pyrus ussuriensis x Pyrus communis]